MLLIGVGRDGMDGILEVAEGDERAPIDVKEARGGTMPKAEVLSNLDALLRTSAKRTAVATLGPDDDAACCGLFVCVASRT